MKESLDSKKTIDIFKTNENGQFHLQKDYHLDILFTRIKAPNGI